MRFFRIAAIVAAVVAGGAAAENIGDPVCGILRRFGVEIFKNFGSDRGNLCSPFFVNYDHKWECNRCVTA